MLNEFIVKYSKLMNQLYPVSTYTIAPYFKKEKVQ